MTNIPIGKPYEVLKLILRILLSAEGRPKITDINSTQIQIEFPGDERDDSNTFQINLEELNREFIQNIFLDELGVTEIPEFGRIFYEGGRVTLALLLLELINYYRKEAAVGVNTEAYTSLDEIVATFDDEFYKIFQSIKEGALWQSFTDKVKLTEAAKKVVTLEPTMAFTILEEYRVRREEYTEIRDMYNSHAFLVAYHGALLLLLGLFSVMIGEGGLGEDIFVDDFNEQRANDFIAKLAVYDKLEPETKQKFLSLALIFFSLNRFLRIYSGISLNDPLVVMAANIGVAVSDLLKADSDWNYVDDELRSGLFGSKSNILGFTGQYDALRNFYSYADMFAIKKDIGIPWIVAGDFWKYLNVPSDPDNKTKDNYIESYYTNLIPKYIDTNIRYNVYAQEKDLAIDRSFAYVKDLLIGNELEKFTTVDPFVMYQLVVMAGTIREAIRVDRIMSKFSDERKNKLVFMLWALDAVIFTLYKMWFKSGKYYNQAKRPLYSEDFARTTLGVLKSEVDSIMDVYSESFIDEGIFAQMAHNKAFLASRNTRLYFKTSGVANSLYLPEGAESEEIIDAIVKNKYAIVISEIYSEERKNLAFDKLSFAAKTLSTKANEDILKTIAESTPAGVFDDPLLDKLVSVANTLRNKVTLPNELFIIQTLPFLSFIERMVNEKNVGNYFEFKNPDALTNSNYEYILNETVLSSLEKYEKMSTMF